MCSASERPFRRVAMSNSVSADQCHMINLNLLMEVVLVWPNVAVVSVKLP